jgi:hypothetical protein
MATRFETLGKAKDIEDLKQRNIASFFANFNKYKKAVDDFSLWSANHPNQLLLYQQIEKLIERREYGDLKDLSNRDFPSYDEIYDSLDRRKKYQVKSKFREVEGWGKKTTDGLRYDFIKEYINQLPHYQRLALKEEFVRYLVHSEAGKKFLQESAEFGYSNSTAIEEIPPFSLPALDSDLEEFSNLPDYFNTIDNSLKVITLIQILLPEYYKNHKIDFPYLRRISVKFAAIFFEGVNNENFPIEELYRVDVRTVKVKNKFKQQLGNMLPYLNLTFHSIQFGYNLKKYRESERFEDAIELGNNLADLIKDTSEVYQSLLKNNQSSLLPDAKLVSRVGNFAEGFSNYVFSPIQFSIDLQNAALAVLSGDNRLALGYSISGLGVVTGLALTFLGVSTPVGLIVALGFAAVAYFAPSIFYSKQRNDLMKWLESNYFSNTYVKELPKEVNINPMDPRFEWNNQKSKKLKIFHQIQSLYSILNPAVVDYNNHWFETDNELLSIIVNSPPLRLTNYWIKLRFFNKSPWFRERSNHNYQIPLFFEDPNFAINPEWEKRNSWFKEHRLTIEEDDKKQKHVKKYELKIEVEDHVRVFYHYVQIQFIPLPEEYNFLRSFSNEEKEAFENHPFRLTYTIKINVN